MEEKGEKGASGKPSSEVDRLSKLPESLISQILLNLPTKDVVRSSVLSSKWRNRWKDVPGLDLEYRGFREANAFVSFVDMFLDFNSEWSMQSFKLKYHADGCERDIAHVTLWINNVLQRKIKHFNVVDYAWEDDEIQIPPTVYKCQKLVSLKLNNVILADTEFVSLPCLKTIDMDLVKFANDLAFEKLISGCPVLESFTIRRSILDNVDVLRVCSKSLLSFTHVAEGHVFLDKILHVLIDAPMLKYLKLSNLQNVRFITNSPLSIVKVDMDILPDFCFGPEDIEKRQAIRNFFDGISGVQEMIVRPNTVMAMYFYSRHEPQPQFRNLSYVHAQFVVFYWDIFPSFLESCPNLKSLVVESGYMPERPGPSLVSVPQCLKSSLEFVKLESPIVGNAMEVKLVSYFLENSVILKKLTLSLDTREKEESVILKELLDIPRLSSTCQVLVV